MKKILMLLLLLPVMAHAYTLVSKDGALLDVLRPEKTVRQFVIGTYAPLKYMTGPGVVAVERADSLEFVSDSLAVVGWDSVIYYDADELAAELDTAMITNDYLARLIIESGVLRVAGDTLLMADSTMIILP